MGKPKIGPQADKEKADKALLKKEQAELAKKYGEDPYAIDEADMDSSRAPLLEHLKELRSRLIVSFAALIICSVISFIFVRPIFDMLIQPFELAVERYNAGRSANGLPAAETNLIYTQVLGFFFAKLKVGVFGGLVLSFPIIAYQLYGFIAPGLYKNERAAFLPYLIASPLLFFMGALLVFKFIFPFVIEFGLTQQQGFQNGSTAVLLPKIEEYLSLAMTLFVAFGLSFQLPVILTLMARAGIFGVDALRSGRRYALVGIFLFAAFATPPDPISQLMLGGAIYLLYEISILCVYLIEKKQDEEREPS